VFLRPGTGSISVNHRTFDAFFPSEALRTQIRQPLILTETADKFDILATVAGGGVSVKGWHGQVDANEAKGGQTVANAKLDMLGLHVDQTAGDHLELGMVQPDRDLAVHDVFESDG